MKIKLSKKHRSILAHDGHVLVNGGPGSGKTTIALLKAQKNCKKLKPGQEILFLSFSRAAVRQIINRCKAILQINERELIKVNTYHSFCMEVLETHGRLLCGKQTRFIFPGEELIKKSTFDGSWEAERIRLTTEGYYCFDLFASCVARIFEECSAVNQLYADKYPLIIIDEFQDTDDDQWRFIQALAKNTCTFCLADTEQRIFDYRPNIDPNRIESLRKIICPSEFDLSGDNHRSPTTDILQFADSILNNRSPLPKSKAVNVIKYRGNEFDALVHASVIWILSGLRDLGIDRPCVAVLCRSNALVSKVSMILSQEHTFRNHHLSIVEHDVVWDAELSAASAQIVGSILEWPTQESNISMQKTLELIAHYYRLKNSIKPSNTATTNVKRLEKAVDRFARNVNPRNMAVTGLMQAFDKGLKLTGNPVKDWLCARRIVGDINSLSDIFRDAKMIRLFRATDALATGLSGLWLNWGNYAGASHLVKQILDRERLLSLDRDPRGCILMNIHKSKGKEFDGVVLVEGNYSSRFFDLNENPPYKKSRRLLRVGITRARHLVMIIRYYKSPPLVDSK